MHSAAVKSGDLLGLIKTCGTIVIDVSRDIEALTNGKKLFKSFKKEILSVQGKDNGVLDMKNKRLIVVVSTVMTWAGTDKRVSLGIKKLKRYLQTTTIYCKSVPSVKTIYVIEIRVQNL